ncbi:MAG: hypothetical protein Q8859_08595 [Bacteroidota bacterium]|nr:hypothetical protein [Bacteroidota bacterium]
MSVSELTTDMPEQRDLTPKDYWDKRARGLGATIESPLVSCAEENVLGYDNDRYYLEDILMHEFAHVIHQMGMNCLDPEFDENLKKLYEGAKKKGLWINTYAGSNYSEYWAEGVQSWFNVGSTKSGDGVHNGIYNRKQLKKYDPELYKLISSVFKSTRLNVRNISKHVHLE